MYFQLVPVRELARLTTNLFSYWTNKTREIKSHWRKIPVSSTGTVFILNDQFNIPTKSLCLTYVPISMYFLYLYGPIADWELHTHHWIAALVPALQMSSFTVKANSYIKCNLFIMNKDKYLPWSGTSLSRSKVCESIWTNHFYGRQISPRYLDASSVLVMINVKDKTLSRWK